MKIQVTPSVDFLKFYFLSAKKICKNAKERLSVSIIDNHKNIIIINNQKYKVLDDIFNESSPLRDEYTNFLTELIDNDRAKSDVDSTIKEIFVNVKRRCYKIDHATLNAITKNNRHGIIFDILASRQKKRFHYDFKSTHETKRYIKSAMMIFGEMTDIVYIDRYFENLARHDLFKLIQGKQIRVLTLKQRNGRNINRARLEGYRQSIVQNGYGTDITVFYTNNPNLIHERMLFLKDFCISANECFRSVSNGNQTWYLDFSYIQDFNIQWKKKESSFIKL